MRKLNPYFGEFGGQYVPEILILHWINSNKLLLIQNDPSFQQNSKIY